MTGPCVDLRTRHFLEGALSAKEPNYDAIDNFLLCGIPDGQSKKNKPPLKIGFFDFWPDHDHNNNVITAALSGRFDISLEYSSPDIAFFSVFGSSNKQIKARKRIFFTGENVRPDFNLCDMAISFDYMNDCRNYRLPLYVFHCYDYVKWGITKNFCEIIKPRSVPTPDEFSQKKFCAFIYQNPTCQFRNDFFMALNEKKPVDAIGPLFNNTGYQVKPGWGPKIRISSLYKFVFAFENSAHPGYTTEKIIEPIISNVVPLYWGSPRIHEEINERRFININTLTDIDSAINDILAIEQDYERYVAILSENPALGAKQFYFDVYRLAEWIEAWL